MIFGYLETLQGEGKIGVGMTPTNLHYVSNKVYPLKVTMFVMLKACKTIKSYPIKGFQHHVRSVPG